MVVLAQRSSFQQYGPDLGLKSTQIRALLQDRHGLIWVATRNGLFRFDGYRFTAFDERRGLPSSDISALAESSDGTLWAATPKGLVRRVGEHFEIASSSAAAMEINGLALDHRGNLYASTKLGLIAAQTNGTLEFHTVSSLPAWAVTPDPSGEGAWFSCGTSICSYRRGKLETHGGLPAAEYRALVFDRLGKLWARSAESLYADFHAVAAAEPTYRTRPFLFEDRAGGMWTNAPSGAARNGVSLGTQQGLASEGVTAILEDREGALWFGHDGAGLERKLGTGGIAGFTRLDGLSDDNVQALEDDGAGGVWLGHSTNRIDHGRLMANGLWTWKSYPLPAPARDVIEIRRLGNGTLVVLTRQGSPLTFSPSSAAARPTGPAAAGHALRVLDESWIAFSVGIYDAKGTKIAFPDGVEALDVVKDHSGRIWVAHATGLSVLDGGAWQNFTEADGLASGGVEHLAEDPSGDIWLAYRDGAGIARLRAQSARIKDGLHLAQFRKGRGLTCNYVRSLAFDSAGRLWVATDRGADIFDGSTGDGSDWTHFGQQQGLIWDEINPGAAVRSTADGVVWLGTSKGLTRYGPSETIATAAAASTATMITSVETNKGWVDQALPVVLEGASNSITIRYSALRFTDASAVKYRYRVTGMSDEWIEAGGHEVTLSYLRPGHYRFDVQSDQEPGGHDQGPTAAIEFAVAESWMVSTWVRVTAFLIGMAVFGWLLYRRRMIRVESERRALEAAVADRTRELEMQKQSLEIEKARAERQNREIERLLEEAKHTSRLKGEFLANMSHEIRTPMNGIIGMINLALSTPLGGDQRDFVETAKNSAESLLSILNDVLDFSKVEAGHLTIDPEPFVVRELVSETCKVFQPRATDKQIGLTFDIASDVPRSVVSDPGRIRQILLNLIGNAVKFTHHGSVRVLLTREGETLHFTVEDTGIGISPDKQKVVFEAFRQADGSTTRRYGGTGLGLAISMKLVSLMGGRLWLESEQGKGSQFHFTLVSGLIEPENQIAVESSQDLLRINKVLGRAESTAAQSLKILLAEDNLVNQRVACRMLEMRGHTVKVVENGAEALQALDRGEVFDLILMDVQMPEMDGIEATRLIRAREEIHGGHIAIVAMTAHTMKGDRERCLAAGMDGYVNKPIAPETFFKAVEGAIGARASQ